MERYEDAVTLRGLSDWTAVDDARDLVATSKTLVGPVAARDLRALHAMPHLARLVLERIDALPAEVCALTALRVLEIDSPTLEALPDAMRTMRSLTVLRLRANKLRTLPAALAEIESLTEIDARHTGVRDVPRALAGRVVT